MLINGFSLKVIVPFILSTLAIIIVSLSTIYIVQTKHIDKLSTEEFEDVSNLFSQSIEREIELFSSLNELIQKDENILNLYKEKKRDELYKYLHSSYSDFNSRLKITHFYIHNTDKTNFLRLHNKDKHSDVIHHSSLNQAVNTSKMASGLELSKNHVTLRVVLPWVYRNFIVAYIEVGTEIELLSNALSQDLSENIVLTIDKNAIKISDNKNYTQLDDYYIINSTLGEVHAQSELFKLFNAKTNVQNIRVDNNGIIYNISSKPFHDASGKEVGKLYLLVDITAETEELLHVLIKALVSLLVIIAFIIYFYYRYIHRIDKQVKNYVDVMEFNYKFEQYVNSISKYLIYGKDLNDCINKTLEELGEILNVNRAYLFMFKNNFTIMDNTHEWCDEGTRREIDSLRDVDTKNISWWIEQCQALKPIAIEDIETLPREANNEKRSLIEQGIKSLLVYPLVVQEKVFGFIGVDMIREEQRWSDTHHSFVKITAESISSAFEKKYYEEEIVDSYDNISLTLDTASNGILVIDNEKILLHNKKFIEMWNINNLEILNSHKLLLAQLANFMVHPEKYLQRLKLLEENDRAELIFLTFLKDGRVLEVTSVPRIKDGLLKGRSFSFRDFTKRVLAEKELELSAKVFENSLEGIIITDAQTNIMKVNNSFSNITGYSVDELIGKKPTLFKSHWHDKTFYEKMWKSLENDSIWEGEVKDRRKNGELYVSLSTLIKIKDNDGNVSNYIGINRDVTDSKMAEEHIKVLAYYDTLTNLPNRTLFYDRLEQNMKYAQRNQEKMALLFVDLDDFKEVNDTYGHHVGDLLLQKVAVILSSSVRDSDTVSRLGGDEFTVILRKVTNRDDVSEIANKIITQLQEPIVINNISLNVGSSIGASIFPDDTNENDKLIKMADKAMYDAKNRGKNCFEFFEDE